MARGPRSSAGTSSTPRTAGHAPQGVCEGARLDRQFRTFHPRAAGLG